MKLIHHSPLGSLQIGGVLGLVEPGEPFDVDDELAESLLEQTELYELADEAALTVNELHAIADELGIDLTGLTGWAEIFAAMSAALASAPAPEPGAPEPGDPAPDPDDQPASEPDPDDEGVGE
jgi:D-tyrosyl-tRNA(Tyr) deacylase